MFVCCVTVWRRPTIGHLLLWYVEQLSEPADLRSIPFVSNEEEQQQKEQ